MSKGDIVEYGTHKELLELDKVYARLVQSQLAQGDTSVRLSIERERASIGLKKKYSEDFTKEPIIIEDKESPFLERNLSKGEVIAKKLEEERIKKDKEEEDAKFFSQSQSKLMGLLSDIKFVVVCGVIASAINGGVWPMYGWFMSIGIESLGIKDDPDRVKSESITVAIYFLILAVAASLAGFFQTYTKY